MLFHHYIFFSLNISPLLPPFPRCSLWSITIGHRQLKGWSITNGHRQLTGWFALSSLQLQFFICFIFFINFRIFPYSVSGGNLSVVSLGKLGLYFSFHLPDAPSGLWPTGIGKCKGPDANLQGRLYRSFALFSLGSITNGHRHLQGSNTREEFNLFCFG